MKLDLRRNAEAVQAIRKAAIDAKIVLSSQPSVKLDIPLPEGRRYQREITRQQFETLIEPVIQRTIDPVSKPSKTQDSSPNRLMKSSSSAARPASLGCSNSWRRSSIAIPTRN